MKKQIMSAERLADSLAIVDLTDPKNGLHAINILIENIKKALAVAYPDSNIEVHRTDARVSVKENFDDLLFPKDNAGRSSRYTRYVNEETVFRTHTSAAIPGWLNKKTDLDLANTLLLIPGMCYRRDVVDKTHCGEPHQMDVWRFKKDVSSPYGRTELIHLVQTILNSTVPEYEYRANEKIHPYTLNGLEIEILVNGQWIEVLECGVAHPTILENAGFNSEKFSGLALGMGVDRLVMIIKGIDDIRILRSEDPRIKSQMLNLNKFIPVSSQPSTKRVLSYSASLNKNEEDVCEQIRDNLGPQSKYIEKIEYSETAYDELPEMAKNNLGIHPDQKNIVVTLVFRSHEGSLEKEVVNEWVKHLYPKLNQGDKGYM